MARKSSLTDEQWDEIKKRILAGEKPAQLATEFKVSRQSIHNRLNVQVKSVKSVANQIVETEVNLQSLPVNLQIEAVNLASDLLAISKHMASGARYGAMTFHRLAGIANQHTQALDDSAPSEESLMTIAKLTRTGNDAAAPALNLLAANKDQVSRLNEPKAKAVMTLNDFYGAITPEP